MADYLDKKITELRKSGEVDEAYSMAKQALEAEPDNFFLRGAMSWVLYEKIKSSAEMVKAELENRNYSDSGELSKIESALDEYLELSLPVPDLSLSLILSRLIKPVGQNVSNFLPFLLRIVAKSDEIFRDEDKEPYFHDKGASPSLQSKIARESAACYLRGGNQDNKSATLVTKFLERAHNNEKETPQNKVWIGYDLSKLYSKLGDKERAIEYAKETVRRNKADSWAWHELGKLYVGTSQEKAVACLCEAVKCPHEEDKIGKLRLDLAALLKHSGDIESAITECLIVAHTYEEKGWKFPQKLQDAMAADWFDVSLAKDDNEEIYDTYADEAIEITYDRVEEVPASFLREVKARDSGKSLVVFGTRIGSDSFQQVRPARIVGETELEAGDAVFLRVAFEGDHEHTLQCKQRDGDKFDCLAVRNGVIVNHSRDGSKAGVYLSEKEETVVQDLKGRKPADFSIGHGVKVWVSQNQTNQHLECFRAEATDSVPKLQGLERFGGTLRGTSGEFGFVEDTFVPPQLMDPQLVGDLVQGLKVLSFDKTKNQPGWKAISLERLSN